MSWTTLTLPHEARKTIRLKISVSFYWFGLFYINVIPVTAPRRDSLSAISTSSDSSISSLDYTFTGERNFFSFGSTTLHGSNPLPWESVVLPLGPSVSNIRSTAPGGSTEETLSYRYPRLLRWIKFFRGGDEIFILVSLSIRHFRIVFELFSYYFLPCYLPVSIYLLLRDSISLLSFFFVLGVEIHVANHKIRVNLPWPRWSREVNG